MYERPRRTVLQSRGSYAASGNEKSKHSNPKAMKGKTQ
jgi:hypothetical protein